ncbi:MAG: LamG domain-containing protein, partial [Planctomycetes bacterium]|nr:LamG domain-containing protein [Planctomycetota bacterium]
MTRSIIGLSTVTVLLFILAFSTTPIHAQLIAYWPLDDTTGSIATEMVYKDHPYINLDGRFGGLPVWDPGGGRIINGQQTGAIYLHGGSDRIIVPQADDQYDPILDFDREPMSLACWIRTDGLGWPTQYAHIVSKGTTYRLYIGDQGRVIWIKSPGGIGIPPGGYGVGDGEWHHLCGTVDAENNVKLYIDGVLDYSYTADPRATYNTNYHFTIGASDPACGWGSNRSMEGWIDEVSVWGCALNQAQINSLIIGRSAPEVNLPPVVDAGPPQINHLPDDPGGYIQFQLNGTVTDQTVFGPNTLSWHWSKLQGPGDVIFQPDNLAVDPIVKMNTAGLYTLVLSASDGVYEANDTVNIQVYPETWTGEVIKYSFENNLEDTSIGGTTLDHLTAQRYIGIRVDDDLPEKVDVDPLTLPYEPGILGQAVRLEEILLNEPIHQWLYDQPEFSGTLLQADTSIDTAFNGYGTFTIEAYIKPDPGINVLGRLLYVAQVDYDRGWRTPSTDDDGNKDVFYLVNDCDPEPYQFGGY